MIYLKNTIDGFKLVIGGFVMNIVLPLTMLIAVRVPTYEDDEAKTKEALYFYIYLIVYHLALAAIRYWSLFMSNWWRENITVCMLVAVITQVLLCHRWVYNLDEDVDFDYNEMSEKQKAWYVWCWIEVAFFYSTIIGAALFTFIRSWFPVIMRVQGNLLIDDVEHTDFLDVESLMIDLFNMISAPFIISLMLGQLCYGHFEGDLYSTTIWQKTSNWFSFVQMILFGFGFFCPRATLYRSAWWNEWMPKASYYAVYICMYVIPVSIIALSLKTAVTDGMQPAEIFFLICQVGTIAWFTVDFMGAFEFYSDRCEEVKKAITKMNDYLKENGIIIEND